MAPNIEDAPIPTEDDVRLLAYKLWEDAGEPDGRETEFWDQARAMLAAPPDIPAPK